jgi:hypothetical protein
MILRMITVAVFVAFAAFATQSVDGLREVRTPNLMRSNSTPDLRMLYNETSIDGNKGIISSNEYKKHIYNRYKRNPYLRSKEKYTFDYK